MMDFLDNTEDYSVALYQRAAAECIADIHLRGLLPVVCGGTGLYVDTLLNNVKLSEESYDEELRRSLLKRAEDEGAEKLLEEVMAEPLIPSMPRSCTRITSKELSVRLRYTKRRAQQ